MAVTDYLELVLGKAFYSARGRDAGLFTKGEAFKDVPENIAITSPNNGESGSTLLPDCTQVGADNFPDLEWKKPSEDVQEYLIVVQDVDAPLPFPIVHGIFFGVPGNTTSIKASDVELVDKTAGKEKGIKAGWNIGKNIRGTHYGGARPLLTHGEHRYFYQVVALKEPINAEGFSKTAATEKQLAEKIRGKVVGWGAWIGKFERKWEDRQ